MGRPRGAQRHASSVHTHLVLEAVHERLEVHVQNLGDCFGRDISKGGRHVHAVVVESNMDPAECLDRCINHPLAVQFLSESISGKNAKTQKQKWEIFSTCPLLSHEIAQAVVTLYQRHEVRRAPNRISLDATPGDPSVPVTCILSTSQKCMTSACVDHMHPPINPPVRWTVLQHFGFGSATKHWFDTPGSITEVHNK